MASKRSIPSLLRLQGILIAPVLDILLKLAPSAWQIQTGETLAEEARKLLLSILTLLSITILTGEVILSPRPRIFKLGLSASTVPLPTSTASCVALK